MFCHATDPLLVAALSHTGKEHQNHTWLKHCVGVGARCRHSPRQCFGGREGSNEMTVFSSCSNIFLAPIHSHKQNGLLLSCVSFFCSDKGSVCAPWTCFGEASAFLRSVTWWRARLVFVS